jgi:hypothetical protein
MAASPVFLVTKLAFAFVAVVNLLVFALPSLAVLALIHRLKQELFAPASVSRRSLVDLLTLSTSVAVRTAKSALGLLCASLKVVLADRSRQATFVS